jgi:hypothetical protein
MKNAVILKFYLFEIEIKKKLKSFLDKKKTYREACYDVSGECNEFLGLLCLNATGSKTKLCL